MACANCPDTTACREHGQCLGPVEVDTCRVCGTTPPTPGHHCGEGCPFDMPDEDDPDEDDGDTELDPVRGEVTR